MRTILFFFALIFFACHTVKDLEEQSFQPAGANYKWWSIQNEKEVASWSVRRNKNIKWQVPLDESGQSGIIKVKNRLYFSIMKPLYKKGVTTGADIVALCYDAETGKKIWARDIKGSLKSPYMYGFSNSSSPTPVSDGKKVWFINCSGRVVCFDLYGNKIWERKWKPINKIGKVTYPFNKQYEPILYKNILLNVEPIYEKEIGKNVNSHYLIALNKNTGKVLWKSQDSLGHYNTPMMGFTETGQPAILIARVGSIHKVPEKPYGFSLINIEDGKRIWRAKLSNSHFLYNSSWNDKYVVWCDNRENLVVLNPQTGKINKKISLSKKVNWYEYSPTKKKYIHHQNLDLNSLKLGSAKGKVDPAWYTNFLKGDYYYFMTFQTNPRAIKNGELRKKQALKVPYYSFCRVNLKTAKVEYLEVPVDVQSNGEYVWRKELKSDITNIRGIPVAKDLRGKT